MKVAADTDAGQIRTQVLPATIETLHGFPAPRPLPQERRVAPVETTVYSVIATMTGYRVGPDSSVQLVLADESGRTIIAQIPDPACAAGSRFLEQIAEARRRFLARFPATDTFTPARMPLELTGVGFFDFIQGQRGMAPNGIALHPVIDIDFTPTPRPKPPPAVGSRRRSVRTPPGCMAPSLSIVSTKTSVCAGDTTTISWQASDPSATVSIDGLGAFLPPVGNRTASVATSTAYSGRATNSCGVGNEAVAVVALRAPASAVLTGPGSAKTGASASLNVGIAGATAWTLTSSLGNSLDPSSGTTSRSVRYTPTRSGSDIVTLVATGGACGTVTRTITIDVTDPEPTGGLRCCDGTRSPTCFDCGNKRGCCSGHGGVCGCPSSLDEEEETSECSQ